MALGPLFGRTQGPHGGPEVEFVQRRLLAPPKERGAYQAFPTVTRSGEGAFLAAFRQGWINQYWDRLSGAHAGSGDVLVVESRDQGRSFGPARMVIDHREEGTNELDSLVTGLGEGEILLITRSHGPDLYGSFWALSIDQGKTFPERRPLRLPSPGVGPEEDQRMVCYGHALPDEEEGGLLLSFYTFQRPGPQQTGLARLDPETGLVEVRGWIWEGEFRSCWLNETSVMRLPDGRLLALCREEPCLSGLYRSFSPDNGRTWSGPEPLGILGEASNLAMLPDGRLAAIFRGLPCEPREEHYLGLTFSEDQGATWSGPLILETYSGGRFHGGYGDLAVTGSGELLAVYYVCQEDEDPVVVASLLKVE